MTYKDDYILTSDEVYTLGFVGSKWINKEEIMFCKICRVYIRDGRKTTKHVKECFAKNNKNKMHTKQEFSIILKTKDKEKLND